jgi:hypothetical protein
MDYIEINPDNISAAQIVVGIPSYNEAQRIAFPVKQADMGLSRYFQGMSSVIINCDNNSPDSTKDAFLATSAKQPKIYLSTPEGVKGKGNNIRNLIDKAVQLSAEAVIILDADLKSVTPRWIRNLGEPLLEGSDFVAPLYVRHKYEGPLTNNFAYPLCRALYGRRVRQPVGGEYGFSAKMADIFKTESTWVDAVSNFGVDMWMTTIAVRRHANVIQSFMGGPRVHDVENMDYVRSDIFRDVVITLMSMMKHYEDFWKDVKWSRPTSIHGFGLSEVEVPPPVTVDQDALWSGFIDAIRSFEDLLGGVLKRENLDKLIEVAGLPRNGFEFPTELWAKILYDFACAFKNNIAREDELVEALKPIFLGKTLSFTMETAPMNTHQVEEYIEDQCIQFEKTKPYLVERWFSK